MTRLSILFDAMKQRGNTFSNILEIRQIFMLLDCAIARATLATMEPYRWMKHTVVRKPPIHNGAFYDAATPLSMQMRLSKLPVVKFGGGCGDEEPGAQLRKL
jgi:hypothetical protein